MRILVTGSKGYIGRYIEMELALRYGVKNVLGFDEPNWEQWKYTWQTQLRHESFDLIIHAGANSMAWYSSADIFWINHESTREILDYCLRHNTRLIYFSSCAALDPVNLYGWSKKTSADLILEMDTQDKFTVVYPYQVYGNESGRRSGYSVPTRILRGEIQTAFDPWIRDYLHVKDLIQMLMKIIDDELFGEYDFGRGVGVSSKELFEYAGLKDFPLISPEHPDYPKNAHAEIVARPKYLVPDIAPTKDVKSYIYYTRGRSAKPL